MTMQDFPALYHGHTRKDYKNALKKTLCWEQIDSKKIGFWHTVGLPLYMHDCNDIMIPGTYDTCHSVLYCL